MSATPFYMVTVSSEARKSLQFYMLSTPTRENLHVALKSIQSEMENKLAEYEEDAVENEFEIDKITDELKPVGNLLEVLRFLDSDPVFSGDHLSQEIRVAGVLIGRVHGNRFFAY